MGALAGVSQFFLTIFAIVVLAAGIAVAIGGPEVFARLSALLKHGPAVPAPAPAPWQPASLYDASASGRLIGMVVWHDEAEVAGRLLWDLQVVVSHPAGLRAAIAQLGALLWRRQPLAPLPGATWNLLDVPKPASASTEVKVLFIMPTGDVTFVLPRARRYGWADGLMLLGMARAIGTADDSWGRFGGPFVEMIEGAVVSLSGHERWEDGELRSGRATWSSSAGGISRWCSTSSRSTRAPGPSGRPQCETPHVAVCRSGGAP